MAALAAHAPARAVSPSIAALDAVARASGNRPAIAREIGNRLFRTEWPAEVNQITANAVGRHLVVGVRMWGVKFHHPLSRQSFAGEVVAVIGEALAAAPQAEEVDLWTSVPLNVGRRAVVNGDLAAPTSRTVFALSALRTENLTSLRERILRGENVYWDATWARTALVSNEAQP